MAKCRVCGRELKSGSICGSCENKLRDADFWEKERMLKGGNTGPTITKTDVGCMGCLLKLLIAAVIITIVSTILIYLFGDAILELLPGETDPSESAQYIINGIRYL